MRKFLLAASLLFAFSAQASYDSSWYIAGYWTGEWPNGFSIHKTGVSVQARAGIDRDLARDIKCDLPFKAVFNPWNSARNELSQVDYYTASKIYPMIAKENFTFDNYDGDDFEIKKGQTIEYLVYGAEGMFTVRIDGTEYAADQTLFDHVEEIPEGAFNQEEWIRLTCENGPIAFIDMRDLVTADQNGETQYIDGIWSATIGSPGVDGYGEARDLTDEEAAN